MLLVNVTSGSSNMSNVILRKEGRRRWWVAVGSGIFHKAREWRCGHSERNEVKRFASRYPCRVEKVRIWSRARSMRGEAVGEDRAIKSSWKLTAFKDLSDDMLMF